MIAMIEEKCGQLALVCRQYGVRRLDVFGSAATEESFDPETSDLDLTVEFDPNQALGPWLKHYFRFKAELEHLINRRVDVAIDSALKHPRLIREVNRARRAVYAPWYFVRD